ncbi:MAG: hypothetical protein AAGI46_06025 [Planctomycetota bacterium]
MPRSNDFLDTSDDGLRNFVTNFSQHVAANAELLGLVDEAPEYAQRVSTYVMQLQAADHHETRGPKSIWLKNQTKKLLIAETRKYAKQVVGLVDVPDELKLDMGLNVPTGERTRIPRPTQTPIVKVKLGEGRQIIVDLLQSASRRSKPNGVTGATIFTHLGPVAPASIAEWNYGEQVTRTRTTVDFPPSPTGDTAWISAFWTNAKGESGPSSAPVSINLPAGGALPQEMSDSDDLPETPMKIAA